MIAFVTGVWLVGAAVHAALVWNIGYVGGSLVMGALLITITVVPFAVLILRDMARREEETAEKAKQAAREANPLAAVMEQADEAGDAARDIIREKPLAAAGVAAAVGAALAVPEVRRSLGLVTTTLITKYMGKK